EDISADYFREFCKLIAQDLKVNELNPGFVALMSNGTSGDANCSDFTKTNWPVNPIIVAKAVAATAMQALADLKYHDWVPLAASEERIVFNVRLPKKVQVDGARELLARETGQR